MSIDNPYSVMTDCGSVRYGLTRYDQSLADRDANIHTFVRQLPPPACPASAAVLLGLPRALRYVCVHFQFSAPANDLVRNCGRRTPTHAQVHDIVCASCIISSPRQTQQLRGSFTNTLQLSIDNHWCGKVRGAVTVTECNTYLLQWCSVCERSGNH